MTELPATKVPSRNAGGHFVTREEREALGRRILSLRVKLGFSQAELARRAFGDNEHRQAIYNYEAGRTWPSVERLDKLALGLETTAPELLEGLPLRSQRVSDVDLTIDFAARVAHLRFDLTLELATALAIMEILEKAPNRLTPPVAPAAPSA